MDLPLTLTIEQEFNLEMYRSQAAKLSAEDARDLLLNVTRQLMIKDNVIRHLIRKTYA